MIKATLSLKEPLLYVSRNTNNDEFKTNILSTIEWEALIELLSIFEVLVKPFIKL
jgi:hypothetical protein